MQQTLRSPAPVKKSFWAHEGPLYLKTGFLSAVLFAGAFYYTKWMGVPNELNKSVADTAVVLIGLSMLISSLCYFWNAWDWSIVYRKYLGLVGFAYAVAHLLLSWGPFLALTNAATWQQGRMWPALTGLLALIIFAIMAAISNAFSARLLGGRNWRYVLRTGYVALILVWFHVVLLKSARWLNWYQEGMKTFPALSLVVTGFIVLVVAMRLLLWWRLSRRSV